MIQIQSKMGTAAARGDEENLSNNPVDLSKNSFFVFTIAETAVRRGAQEARPSPLFTITNQHLHGI